MKYWTGDEQELSEDCKKTFIKVVDSPIGKLRLTADECGLVEVVALRNNGETEVQELCPSTSHNEKARKIVEQAQRWLSTYFNGELDELRRMQLPPLSLHGTDFQKKVWKETAKIGFGEASTYGKIASSIGNPKAMRAVGSALGSNPILIMIPCHRVLRSDGGLGGFAAGIEVKKQLLRLEKTL